MKRSCKGASGCKAAISAIHANRQGIQRREWEPPAATSTAARAAHASCQPNILGRRPRFGPVARHWKTRVPGLFGMRHWIDPRHKEKFIRKLEAIKKQTRFQRLTYGSTADTKKRLTFLRQYKREVGRILRAFSVDLRRQRASIDELKDQPAAILQAALTTPTTEHRPKRELSPKEGEGSPEP